VSRGSHHTGTTDQVEAVANAIAGSSLVPTDGEREAAARVLEYLREAGWGLTRRLTREECEAGDLW
jgi:hypothetical protein